MKIRALLFLLSISLASANAGTLTTTFASNNGQSGNAFDILVSTPLYITGFDLNVNSGTTNIEVYTKSGTWVGFDSTPAAWTQVADVLNVTGAGVNLPTHVSFSPIFFPTGTSALYVTTTGLGVNYTDGTGVGNVAASNSDLSILQGAGIQYKLATTFTPRIWNGTIYYSTVPEPSTFALLGLGGAALFWLRRRSR